MAELEASIFVNKLAVAERHLRSTIRMFFMEEDELAVHLVAHAAYNIFSDILRLRGMDEAAHSMEILGMIAYAKDYSERSLTASERRIFSALPEAMQEALLGLVREYPEKTVDELFSHVESNPSSAFVKNFWQQRRRTYNLIKHADRDSASLMDLSEVNNAQLIFRCIVQSLHLNCGFDEEKEFFYNFYLAKISLAIDSGSESAMYYVMVAHDEAEIYTLARRRFCYARISDVEIDFDRAKERIEGLFRPE